MSVAYDWDSLRAHDGPPQQFAEPLPETKGSKRSRQTYSKYQTAVLETVFQTSKYIVRSKRQQMSAELNLTERQIKIWFQNRRMKEKKCGGVGGLPCKGSPPADDLGAVANVGYVDDYAVLELGAAAGYHTMTPDSDAIRNGHRLSRGDAFTDFCHRPVIRRRPPNMPPTSHHDPAAGYAGYDDCGAGGYDLLPQHEADPYAAAAKQHHHWGAPVTVDYDQDFFGDHDLDNFQTLPTAHHHHHHHRPSVNPQVPDYCPPQLQATHGY